MKINEIKIHTCMLYEYYETIWKLHTVYLQSVSPSCLETGEWWHLLYNDFTAVVMINSINQIINYWLIIYQIINISWLIGKIVKLFDTNIKF